MSENTREPVGDSMPGEKAGEAHHAAAEEPAIESVEVAPAPGNAETTTLGAILDEATPAHTPRTNLMPRLVSIPLSDTGIPTPPTPNGGDDTVDIGPVIPRAEPAPNPGSAFLAALREELAQDAQSSECAGDEDADARPTPYYGLAQTAVSTPALAIGSATDDVPPSADVAADAAAPQRLLDEPPLDEESAPFPPVVATAVPAHQVRLHTADDTAAALRLLPLATPEVLAGSPSRLDDPAGESPECTEPSDQHVDLHTAAILEPVDQPEPTLPWTEPLRTVGAAPSSASASEHSRHPRGSVPAVVAASDQRRGGSGSLAWGGAAAALTLLTAWWFVSPHDAPSPGSQAAGLSGRVTQEANSKLGANPASLLGPADSEGAETGNAPGAAAAAMTGGEVRDPSTGVARPAGDAATADGRQDSPDPALLSSGQAEARGTGSSISETDKEVARAALRETALSAGRCRIQGDPSGWTRVTVTFESSGHVSYAKVLKDPFKDTNTAECIEGQMKQITVPPFEGGPWTLTYPVEVF